MARCRVSPWPLLLGLKEIILDSHYRREATNRRIRKHARRVSGDRLAVLLPCVYMYTYIYIYVHMQTMYSCVFLYIHTDFCATAALACRQCQTSVNLSLRPFIKPSSAKPNVCSPIPKSCITLEVILTIKEYIYKSSIPYKVING